MKKVMILALVSAVVTTGCATTDFCSHPMEDECTMFNGMSIDSCNAHVPEVQVETLN